MLRAKSSQLSFYGNHIYDRVIPEDHFLQSLYDVSDRRIEEEVNVNLVLKWFVGLAVDEAPPDSSSLTRFRGRLGEERFANIFNQIVEIAREEGLISDRLSIVDSTDVKAKVDTFKIKDDPNASPEPVRLYFTLVRGSTPWK